jgi:hypothetical protein
VKIVVLCEGKTEAAIKNGLREVVHRRTGQVDRIGIKTIQLKGHMHGEKFMRLAQRYLEDAENIGVVALTDVYPNHKDAIDAKTKLKELVANLAGVDKFRPHAAQYEIEAWLMPFWDEVARDLGVNKKKPGANPEEINNEKPPSKHLQELFGLCKQPKTKYEKVIDGPKWLTADRLEQAAKSCPELKAFLNSLIEFAGGEIIP